MAIEPRIRPLVDALNATGLVQTFTSCEGHYGADGAGASRGREQASVGFFLREGVPERELARLFGAVLSEWQRAGTGAVELTIAKHFVAGLDGAEEPEVFFDVILRPSDPASASEVKRAVTDRGLAVATRAVTAARWRARWTDRRLRRPA